MLKLCARCDAIDDIDNAPGREPLCSTCDPAKAAARRKALRTQRKARKH